jgi:hypothetical protein
MEKKQVWAMGSRSSRSLLLVRVWGWVHLAPRGGRRERPHANRTYCAMSVLDRPLNTRQKRLTMGSSGPLKPSYLLWDFK